MAQDLERRPLGSQGGSGGATNEGEDCETHCVQGVYTMDNPAPVIFGTSRFFWEIAGVEAAPQRAIMEGDRRT